MAIMVLGRSLILVLAVLAIHYYAAESALQVFYPGIFVDFHCKVRNPFIQVNDLDVSLRGINGYVKDLRALGIEAKNVSSPNIDIPTVCVNGSSPELSQVVSSTINIICQELLQHAANINHFNFTLTYQSRLPAPASVSLNINNNILEWSRPPSVTNSSSDTYSIEVNHTLEFTYNIYITLRSDTTDGTTVTVTIAITAVSNTSYDLSLTWDMLQPCSLHTIKVSACNSETMPCDSNERSPPITYTMPGCPVNPNPSASEDTATTIPSSPDDSTKQTTVMTATIVASVVCFVAGSSGGGFVGIVSVLVYNHMKTRKKNNNNMVGARVSTQPAAASDYIYEEVFEPQSSVEMKENVAYGPIK